MSLERRARKIKKTFEAIKNRFKLCDFQLGPSLILTLTLNLGTFSSDMVRRLELARRIVGDQDWLSYDSERSILDSRFT